MLFWALPVKVGCRQVAAFGDEEGGMMGSVLYECPDEGMREEVEHLS
jgi:hypothetical protein